MAEPDKKQTDEDQQSERVVLCATRGGPASYPNQDAAIALAKARGQDIVFVNVTNVKFLDKVSSAILVDMDEQMEELGEFLLLMAKERAERAGVRAHTEVRTGPFCQTLIDAAHTHHADVVVFGQPGESGSLFKTEQLQKLGECLRKETGMEVVLL
jgi:nucleotide-binding universal stress UspA family protein